MPHLSSSLDDGPDPGRGVLGDHARHAPDAHQRAGHRAGPDHPDPDPDGRGRHPDPGAPAGRDELLVPVLHAQVAAAGQAAGQEPDQVAAASRVTLNVTVVHLRETWLASAWLPRAAGPYRSRLAHIAAAHIGRGWPSVTAASSAPDRTTWLPQPCRSSSMSEASMQYERAR